MTVIMAQVGMGGSCSARGPILTCEGALLALALHPAGAGLDFAFPPLLAGVLVRARRQSSSLAACNAALQRLAGLAETRRRGTYRRCVANRD